MSKRRWITRLTQAATQTEDDAYRALPFTRQVRFDKRFGTIQPIRKVVNA
ncbi:MAG: hypothetical protein AAGF78_10265 [Pseudomonadota bacterium]